MSEQIENYQALPLPEAVPSEPVPGEPVPGDPDRPAWGPLAGIGAWLVSVAAIIVFPLIALVGYLAYFISTGGQLQGEALRLLLESPGMILVLILATIPAHLFTAAVCWFIVRQTARRPLWESLGLRWQGRSVLYKVLYIFLTIAGVLVMMQLVSLVVPAGRETDFDRILKVSEAVRISVAIMAVLSAPVVEELVYRGLLYSGLRKAMNATSAVIIVTLLFAGVHFLQYWGAWRSLVGITLLSLILTIIRAHTKSLMPPIIVHFIFNFIGATEIIIKGGSQ